MNFPRVAAAAVAAWITALAVGYVVNEILFKSLFVLQPFYRPEAEVNGMLPLGFAFLLVGFFAFAYAFAKGYEGTNGVMEGVRFGVLIAVMIDCFAMIWNYVMLPMPAGLAVASMLDPIVEMSIYGAIVGAIYKPAEKTARRSSAVV
jgi:hypothetical protein